MFRFKLRESNDITLDIPTKNGYTFGGWYTNSDLQGTAITKITSGSTGNKEYYAEWTANKYIVTLK